MAEAAPLPVDVLGRPYAAWWRRVVALVIDSLVVGIPARILTIVLIGIPTQGQTEGAASYQARLVSRADLRVVSTLAGRCKVTKPNSPAVTPYRASASEVSARSRLTYKVSIITLPARWI